MTIIWKEQRDATGFVSFKSECGRYFAAQWSILGVPYWDFWLMPSRRIGFYPSKAAGTKAIEGFEEAGIWPIELIDNRSNLVEIQAENARLTAEFRVRQEERDRQAEVLAAAEAEQAAQKAKADEEAEKLRKQQLDDARRKAEADQKAKAEAEEKQKQEAAALKAEAKTAKSAKKPKKPAAVVDHQPTLF